MGIIAMAKDNYFILGGIDSRDYDMIVSCDDAFVMPERDIDTFEVPGRNGELIVDNGRFKNVDIVYKVVIEKDFAEKVNAFKREVGKLRGYVRLEDTFDFDVYRMANVQEVKIDELGMRYNGGTFEIKVNCKPQKFLKDGETPLQFVLANVNDKADDSQMLIDSSLVTRWFPVSSISREIEFELHDRNTESGSAHIEVRALTNPSASYELIYDEDFEDGDIVTVTIPSGYSYYSIEIRREVIMHITNVWARVRGWTQYNGIDISYNALMSRSLNISNPTGYRAKPLLETYLFPAIDFKITNYTDGVAEEYYIWRSTSETAERHVFLDCDVQYIYDADGNNMSQYLYIATAQDRKGKSLVFPEFGPDEIEFGIDYRQTSTAESADYAPSLLFAYPRWWTV